MLEEHCQLPSGWSDEQSAYVDCQDSLEPLKGIVVLLVLKKSHYGIKELNFWEGLLRNMGASILNCKRIYGKSYVV